MGNKDLTEPQTKKKDSRDLKIKHLKYYQCIHEERQNNTKQNIILSERKIPAEIKVIYIELIENGRKKINTLNFWDRVTPNTRVIYYHGIPSLAFPVFKPVNPICHFINGQEMSDKKSTRSNNFTWIHTSPCCPLGDTVNIPLFCLLIFLFKLRKRQPVN